MGDGTGLAEYLERFGRLRQGKVGDHHRPHKPAMLLAVLSLADNGGLTENRIVPDPELVELFRKYFDVTRAGNDQCTPENPFFYLRGEDFWHLHARAGAQAPIEGMTAPGSWATIVDRVGYASLDEDLFALIATPVGRESLRETLIATYFPEGSQAIHAIVAQEQAIGSVRSEWADEAKPMNDEKSDARDAAFARTVKRAYDYRCAACGIRFVYEDTTLIDAAHLLPWAISHDDRPQNGMALCKNHHWVMDKRLLSPGPDLKWHVSKSLDRRIEGQTELLKLNGEKIILPAEDKMKPDPVALQWRVGQLR
jgi:putative restriction endonuclease